MKNITVQNCLQKHILETIKLRKLDPSDQYYIGMFDAYVLIYRDLMGEEYKEPYKGEPL